MNRIPATTMVLHDEVLEILTADTILNTSALAPLGEHGEGDCVAHDGCLSISRRDLD